MKYIMTVKDEGADDAAAWTETYDNDKVATLMQAVDTAKEMIASFNRGCPPRGQTKRVIVKVEIDYLDIDYLDQT